MKEKQMKKILVVTILIGLAMICCLDSKYRRAEQLHNAVIEKDMRGGRDWWEEHEARSGR